MRFTMNLKVMLIIMSFCNVVDGFIYIYYIVCVQGWLRSVH